MGDCRYCGKPAGLLRSVHKQCDAKHNFGTTAIAGLLERAAKDVSNIGALKSQLEDVAKANFISESELESLVVDNWGKAVETAFEDTVLTSDEESNLAEIKNAFDLTQQDLDGNGAFTKVVKGSVLRSILNGDIPERVRVEGNIPFNLQKNEKLVWIFQGVKYYEQKTRRHYVGGSSGVNIRVAKGVYFRTGNFRAQPVETTETAHADTGILGVTNKHLYFAGAVKSFRIAYPKVVSFEPFSDGIGIQRDAATAKPQRFVTGDGWFTYNLVMNLSRL
jgi:hypothetical protein